MVQINFASREVNCKIVYYGPGRCGKTTNLQLVHEKAPANSTGELVSIATETDRTLYFDFLPLDLGTVAGMRTKFQLYTVPGQVYYDATRKLVLQGCDGVVFVADSNPDLMAENIESLDNLAKNLKENGLDLMDIPLCLQFNKRDLPNAMSVAEMNTKLNRNNWPTVEAVAVNGDGVFQTLKAISQGVIKRLNREQGFSDDGQKRGQRPSLGIKPSAANMGAATSNQQKSVQGAPPTTAAGKTGPAAATRTAPAAPLPPKGAAPIPPKTTVPGKTSPTPPGSTKTGPQPGGAPSAKAPATGPVPAATGGGANPFRDRLNQLKHSGGENVEAASTDASSEPAVEAPAKKGCLLRSGAAAALVFAVLFYFLH